MLFPGAAGGLLGPGLPAPPGACWGLLGFLGALGGRDLLGPLRILALFERFGGPAGASLGNYRALLGLPGASRNIGNPLKQ